MESVINNLLNFIDQNPLAASLLGAILLDVVSGIAAAGVEKKISSKISFNGMYQKFQIIFIVAASNLLQWTMARVIGQNWPIAGSVAVFFILREFISILENAQRSGITIPKFLSDKLEITSKNLSDTGLFMSDLKNLEITKKVDSNNSSNSNGEKQQ